MAHDGVRLAELVARQQIADVIRTLGRATDRADVALFRDCYHPDAQQDHGRFQGDAWEFAEHSLRLQRERYQSANHHLGAPLIELDGERASSETYVQAVMIGTDGEGRYAVHFGGRYLDAFERRAGRWRIAQRVTVNDYVLHQRIAGPVRVGGDDPVFLVGTQDGSDPVYRSTTPSRGR